MEARELRIENFVNRRGRVYTVKGLKEQNLELYFTSGHYLSYVEYSEINPTPLTEEWLLKLGFNKEYKKGYIGIDFGNTDFVLSTPDNEDNNTGKYAWFFRQGRVPMFKPIDFVHELQNLYHALTGEELEIKKQ